MQGLNDTAQSIIVFISGVLIIIGTIPVSGVPDEYRWIISIAGVIGLGIKERLGAKEKTRPTPPP